jgi:phage tail tape-measure protein
MHLMLEESNMGIFKVVVGAAIGGALGGPIGALIGGGVGAAMGGRPATDEDVMKMRAAQQWQQQWLHNPANPANPNGYYQKHLHRSNHTMHKPHRR